MSISYITAAANARLAAGLTAAVSGQSVDGGSSYGVLQIGTSGMGTVLCSITLQKPSFSIASKVATLLGVPLSGTASNTGTAASAQITDSASNVIISGLTVGTSGTDIIITSTSITSGETVTITSGTITTQ
jgi:hypothetical protein